MFGENDTQKCANDLLLRTEYDYLVSIQNKRHRSKKINKLPYHISECAKLSSYQYSIPRADTSAFDLPTDHSTTKDIRQIIEINYHTYIIQEKKQPCVMKLRTKQFLSQRDLRKHEVLFIMPRAQSRQSAKYDHIYRH